MEPIEKLKILLRSVLVDTINQPNRIRRYASIISILEMTICFKNCTTFIFEPTTDWKSTVLAVIVANVNMIVITKIITFFYYAESISSMLATIRIDIPNFIKGKTDLLKKYNQSSKTATWLSIAVLVLCFSVEINFVFTAVLYTDHWNIFVPPVGTIVPNIGFLNMCLNTLHQIFVLQIIACVTIAGDGSSFYYFMLHAQSGYDILVSSVKHLDIEDDIDAQLFEHIKYQLSLDKLVLELKKVYSIQINVHMAYSMAMVCFTFYSIDSKMVYIMVPFAIVIVLEIFVICYLGQLIIYKSGQVSGALYEWPHWLKINVRSRRHLLLMMAGAQRPRHISSGLVQVSLSTFISVMKMSYTFYTVLRNTGY